MPRQLLRDGRIVSDDWQYLTEIEAAAAANGAAVAAAVADGAAMAEATLASLTPATVAPLSDLSGVALILPFDRWTAERERWSSHEGRLGIALLPAHKVEALAPDLERFALVAAEFPGPSDGRGYTQGRLLRERYVFRGELRAAGYVRRDQLFFLARCGFNSFQMAEHELASAETAFTTFSAEYQPSNDEGLAHPLHRRSV
jgi:uncharacterized protein (DUF934 family)